MRQPGLSITLEELIKLRLESRLLSFLNPSTVYARETGEYLSGFRGRGMDFEETRSYQWGDDIRTMDWKVTARTGVAHTKIFKEERERPIFIVSEFSPSLFFGTKNRLKSISAAKAAALIAWAAIGEGARVGAVIASPAGYVEHAPKSRRLGILPLLKTLSIVSNPFETHSDIDKASQEPSSNADLAGALERVQTIAPPRSLIFILSDFQSSPLQIKKPLSTVAAHHDVTAYYLLDPLEKKLPPPNHYVITNGSQLSILNTHAKKLHMAYQKQFNEHFESIKTLCTSLGVSLLTLSTEDDIVKILRQQGEHCG